MKKKTNTSFNRQGLTVMIDGKKTPVVTTMQSAREWAEEYKRAERWKRLAISEFVIVLVCIGLRQIIRSHS